jgi:hypothetical protein
VLTIKEMKNGGILIAHCRVSDLSHALQLPLVFVIFPIVSPGVQHHLTVAKQKSNRSLVFKYYKTEMIYFTL